MEGSREGAEYSQALIPSRLWQTLSSNCNRSSVTYRDGMNGFSHFKRSDYQVNKALLDYTQCTWVDGTEYKCNGKVGFQVFMCVLMGIKKERISHGDQGL